MRNKLIKQLKEIGVLQKRKFVLTSGKTADFYVDLKKAYGESETLELICKCLKPKLKNATCVAGSGYGGAPLATALSLRNKLKLILVRDKPRSHGTGAWIDGHVPDKKDRVLVVDDVVTTGGSLKKTASVLKKTGTKIVGYAVVVKRGDAKIATPIDFILDVKEL